MNLRRLVLMGTPDFAVPAFDALFKAGHDIACVYSQPPRPAGRGQHVQKSPVQIWAETQGLLVRTPVRLKDAADHQDFADLQADVAVVAAYGLILPQAILSAPRFGCLNIHASLLPRWRGASPIHHALWQGDSQTGITIMQMEKGLDTGPMLLKGTIDILSTHTTPVLHDALSAMGAQLIVQAVANITTLVPEVQDCAAHTYAPLLKKTDGLVDWSQPAYAIDRQIRALNPWPGTHTHIAGKRLKILACAIGGTHTHTLCGALLNDVGDVACGGGTVLRIMVVQPDSSRAMPFADAVRGGHVHVGAVLS